MSERHRWYAVAALFLVGVFNLMDRQILSILLESVKRDLAASDTAMGLLTGPAFVLFYTLASLPLARIADSRSRRALIAGSLALWSIMTAASGLAASFAQLAVARMGVGIGEAATGPATQSMLADLFPRRQRTVALAIFGVATPVGLMMAFVAGGWLHEAVGWRTTLVLVGLPGLALALLVATTIPEPPRGAADADHETERDYGIPATIAYLWSLPTMRHVGLGASLSIFTGWALMVWGPSFLIRVHGLSTADAGVWLGLASGVGGIAGTLGSGIAAQRLAARDERWLMLVPTITCATAVPFIVLFLLLPTAALAAPMFFGVMMFGTAMLGPMMTATQSLAKIRMRAMAAAIVGVVFNLLGSGLGPLLVGILSDLLAPAFGASSIRVALLACCTVAMSGAAVHFRLAANHLERDLAVRARAG